MMNWNGMLKNPGEQWFSGVTGKPISASEAKTNRIEALWENWQRSLKDSPTPKRKRSKKRR